MHSIFAFFSVMLVHISVIRVYVDNISHFVVSVCFWQLKRLVVFWCVHRFFWLFEEMDQSVKCIKFCVKNEIKYARTFEMLTVTFGESIKFKFNCVIIGLRKAGKMSMTILVLVARALQQSMKIFCHFCLPSHLEDCFELILKSSL